MCAEINIKFWATGQPQRVNHHSTHFFSCVCLHRGSTALPRDQGWEADFELGDADNVPLTECEMRDRNLGRPSGVKFALSSHRPHYDYLPLVPFNYTLVSILPPQALYWLPSLRFSVERGNDTPHIRARDAPQ